MTRSPAVRRKETIDTLFADGAVPRLGVDRAMRIVESARLSPLIPVELAASRVADVASGILLMEYGSGPGAKGFRRAKEALQELIASLESLTVTTAAAPTEVRAAVQTVSDWFESQSQAEDRRRGEKSATRRIRLRDVAIVRLFVELFGNSHLSESIARKGISEDGTTARFMLAFYAEVKALLEASPAAFENGASHGRIEPVVRVHFVDILTGIAASWAVPSKEQIRGAIRAARKGNFG